MRQLESFPLLLTSLYTTTSSLSLKRSRWPTCYKRDILEMVAPSRFGRTAQWIHGGLKFPLAVVVLVTTLVLLEP